MKNFLLTILVLILPAAAFSQSGRIKKGSDEKPQQRPAIELPTRQILVKATPTPTPTPQPKTTQAEDNEDVLRVESVLIPIPVSVTDERGNAVSNLKISDFELRIDVAVQEISDI